MKLGFTGHRRQRLTQYTKDVDSRLYDLAKQVLIKYQPTEVISGMALGWDMAVANAAKSLDIPLIAMIPFYGFSNNWHFRDRVIFDALIEYADNNGKVIYVNDPGYAVWKLHKRNESIVDRCDLLIALWDGVEKGGTYECIKYASKVDKSYNNVWKSWIKYA